MDPGSILLKLLAVLFLVGVNAFFVAAEFALIAVRRSRIEQRVRAGDKRARRLMYALEHPEDFISAAQLGITVASIGIGYIAETAFHEILQPLIGGPAIAQASSAIGLNPVATSHVLTIALTLIIVTYMHVVIGEQVPKMISIQKAELVALWTAAPTLWFGMALRPMIRFMSGSANVVTRLFGVSPTGGHAVAHSREEIGILVEQSQQEGMVEPGEERMIHGVFEFGELVARELMTPRRDIIAVPVTASRDDVIRVVTTEAHSRYPVYDANIDDIVGVLLAKDLLAEVVLRESSTFDLRDFMRESYFVPDTKPVMDLLSELRIKNVHLAIVLDEFGGTEGLVTLEDLLEEIVGEIYDEHDMPEQLFNTTPEGHILINGGASITGVNEHLGLNLAEQDFETIGGFVFGELGRVPVKGDRINLNGVGELIVDATRKRRVTLVRFIRREKRAEPRNVREDVRGGSA
jgi:CBS domain containing-hemolysin-like protein